MAAPARFGGFTRFIRQFSRALVWCTLVGLVGGVAFAAKWSPVDPQELADTTPRVDPEAGAEILYRELTVRHVALEERHRTHHVRAKIYSERGIEHFAKVDLPYGDNGYIREVHVRTIKPNGEIVELSPKDIFQREVIKARRDRVRVKSFSPAALQPGAIVEYKYTEVNREGSWFEMMLFQSELPARHVRLRFISELQLPMLAGIKLSARAMFFNCPTQSMKPDRHGYYNFEMRDVAAAKAEPYQPPLIHVQAGVLVNYGLGPNLEPKAYWTEFGRSLHERMLDETKPTKQVRAVLAAIVAEGDSDEEKLLKIYDYCRSKLMNRYSDIAQFTPEQRAKFTENETASETLKRGHGTIADINGAFVALARAAGFDARYAAANDRSSIFFQSKVTESFMVSDIIAAVRTGDSWRYFDPGVRYLPFATPHWQNTGTSAIIAAPKDLTSVLIDFSPADVSQEVRTAKLELDADGTLAGEVSVEYTGNRGLKMKQTLDAKTVTERETYVREEIQEQLKLAELTEIKVENADDPIAPLVISYHVSVPGYADRTGSRLFLQPALFQKNVPAVFPDATRKHAILFPYPYAEADSIRIQLPDDFELEQASAPARLDLGKFGTYSTRIALTNTGTLLYHRNFALHMPNLPPGAYPAVRQAFAEIHERDAHTLTLKRKEPAAGAVASSP